MSLYSNLPAAKEFLMKYCFLFKVFFLVFILPLEAEGAQPSWHQSDIGERTERWKLAPNKEIEWRFDHLGNRFEWSDWTGRTVYVHDLNNYIASVWTPKGEQTFYEHDPLGKLLKIVYPSKKEVSYTYAPGGALKTVTFLGQTVLYDYDNDRDLLISKKMSSGLSTEYAYNEARRLSDIIHRNSNNALIAHFHFEYDAMDNQILVKRMTPTKEITTTYNYDRLYRLIEVSCSDGFFEKYTYDTLGNRLTKETPEGIITYSYKYDKMGCLAQANDTFYDYDDLGCLIKKTTSQGITKYTYNELAQLTKVEDKKHTVTFMYNGQGERLSKTVNGDSTQYSYDDVFSVFQVLEEKNNDTTRQYIYGYSCLGFIENNKVFYYLEDSPGNPVGLIVDETGNIVEQLTYSAFGHSTSSSPVQYNAEHVDLETGLIFLRTRYYDPEVGRFISSDQVPGNLRNPQSLNRYAYVNNNPVNFQDPMGTDRKSV